MNIGSLGRFFNILYGSGTRGKYSLSVSIQNKILEKHLLEQVLVLKDIREA